MKKILVVVDMQNDFLTGTLANESAVKIIPNIKKEIESDYYDKIVFTRDTHNSNYLYTNEGKLLPVVHCVEGTTGWEVCDELKNSVADLKNVQFINKRTFGYNDWVWFFWYVLNINADKSEITLVGTCTDICVVSNALLMKASFPEANVRCIADCCAPLFGSEVKQNAALEVMKSCQIDII